MNRNDEMVLKFRDILKETEQLRPDDLWGYQQTLLKPLLLHARANTKLYADRLAQVFDGDDVDFTKWRKIPILTRADAQQSEKALHARIVPPHLGAVNADETSGSTGRPLRYLANDLMQVAALAMTDRLYRWWRFDGNKSLASFLSPRRDISDPGGTETYGWRSGHLEGRHFLRETTGDVDDHIAWLEMVRPSYLMSYSSMIEPFAEYAARHKKDLRFERVIARGGVVTDEARERCEEVFQAKLVDLYGADEIGQIACQCPHCGNYHVSGESVLVEILDASGEPVKAGKTGRVVLTNLYNYAMPFIRYEIGDYATVSAENNRCKIRLPGLSHIIGRYRNCFTLADGRTLFPNVPMSGFRKYLGYAQIQIIQTDVDQLEVCYVPDGSGKSADQPGLEIWLQQQLDPCFIVETREVDEIPPSSDGKFEDFLSHIPRSNR